jgi:hypothetical protein
MASNKDDFIQLLNNIYGAQVIQQVLDISELNVVRYCKIEKLILALNKIPEIQSRDGCEECLDLYNQIQPGNMNYFSQRKMDLPAWLGNLDFAPKKSIRKEIMILGESVTNTFNESPIFWKPPLKLNASRVINLSFELGTVVHSLEDLEKSKEVGSRHFWRKLNWIFEEIFQKSSKKWLDMLYITDIGHCNCDRKNKLYMKCGRKYLIQELELISPRIILVQGKDSLRALLTIIYEDVNWKITPKPQILKTEIY